VRSILTEIYLCHACFCHELLSGNATAGVGDVVQLAEGVDAAPGGVLRGPGGGGGASASGVVTVVCDDPDDEEPYQVRVASDDYWWYKENQLVLAADDS
jgi:hypothetical protein